MGRGRLDHLLWRLCHFGCQQGGGCLRRLSRLPRLWRALVLFTVVLGISVALTALRKVTANRRKGGFNNGHGVRCRRRALGYGACCSWRAYGGSDGSTVARTSFCAK